MPRRKPKKKFTVPRTQYEDTLASHLRKLGIRYRRNQKICGFYPDFLLLGTKILIEVDGYYHFTKAGRRKDKIRTAILKKNGYRVVRFSNSQITKDIQKVGRALQRLV